MSRIGLVQFPGSNCDADVITAFKRGFNIVPTLVWHTETALPKVDAVVLPGGFSFGDYLRSGALASHSPVMTAVKAFAKIGGPVIGVCNGFQVLTESHMLPGALLRNASRKFVCEQVELNVAPGETPYHLHLFGKTLRVPVAHGEGRYFIDEDGLKRLKDQQQIVFRYVNNPNGAVDDIAGIVSDNGRVLGMMPHPERAIDPILGSSDGIEIWQAFLATFL